MEYLILSILSSTIIIILFKYIGKLRVNIYNVIVVNYITAAISGFILNNTSPINSLLNVNLSWILLASIIGMSFVLMFYIIGITSQKVGVSVTSVAWKMSVIIPILFTILFYNEIVSLLKISGIIIALLAVAFTIIKKKDKSLNKQLVYLPVLLFMGSGIVDSLLKIVQHDFIRENELPLFSAILFAVAAISGLILNIFRKIKLKGLINSKVLIWGVFLGLANFGSVYFFINALNFSKLDSSLVYGINNVGIVCLSVLYGLIIFNEKLTKLNWLGILLCIVAIWLLIIV